MWEEGSSAKECTSLPYTWKAGGPKPEILPKMIKDMT
jgi:hypothetical protein